MKVVQLIAKTNKKLYNQKKGGVCMQLNQNSIIYGSLIDEYERINRMISISENMIDSLQKGSYQILERKSNKYLYVKYKENGKVISKYIGPTNSPHSFEVINEINNRKKHESIIKKLKEEKKWIEKSLRLKINDERAD